MVVDRLATSKALDRLFGALADATRRDILGRVMVSEASVATSVGIAAKFAGGVDG